MTLTPVPDVLKSTVDYLKTVPELSALVSTAAGWTGGGSGARIAGAIGNLWKVPSVSLRLRRAGGPGPDPSYNGLHRTRLDVWCMAGSERDAVNLWRYLHPAICPDQSRTTGWDMAGCRVTNVLAEVDPIPADDLEAGWWVLLAPYVLEYFESPTS